MNKTQFEEELMRWKDLLSQFNLTQRQASNMLGFNTPDSITKLIKNAKSKGSNFPNSLVKVMNFHDFIGRVGAKTNKINIDE